MKSIFLLTALLPVLAAQGYWTKVEFAGFRDGEFVFKENTFVLNELRESLQVSDGRKNAKMLVVNGKMERCEVNGDYVDRENIRVLAVGISGKKPALPDHAPVPTLKELIKICDDFNKKKYALYLSRHGDRSSTVGVAILSGTDGGVSSTTTDLRNWIAVESSSTSEGISFSKLVSRIFSTKTSTATAYPTTTKFLEFSRLGSPATSKTLVATETATTTTTGTTTTANAIASQSVFATDPTNLAKTRSTTRTGSDFAVWKKHQKLKSRHKMSEADLRKKYLASEILRQRWQDWKASRLLVHRRSRRFIYPGTNWCGAGNVSKEGQALGVHAELDRCCEAHDKCGATIERMTYKYSYFNFGLYTISHCECDSSFRTCLRFANTRESNEIGDIFFNKLAMKCFVLRPEKTCSQRSWSGSCSKYTIKQVAEARNNAPYTIS